MYLVAVVALRNMKSLFAQDDEFVSTQGGDLLFLLRNIAFACLGKPQQYALTLLKQVSIRSLVT